MNLPVVPDPFYWTQASWGAALRCRPLDAVASHLFTTRQLSLSSQDDWHRVAEAVGARHVRTLTQVHGCRVAAVRNAGTRSAGPRAEADVLISNDPQLAIAVRAADCVPLLIADPGTGAVAAVHAGWRGTAAAVAAVAVQALEREFGAIPAKLIAVIGPCIGACCYEVGSELVDAFAAAGHPRHLVDRWFVAPPPRRGESDRPKLRLDTAGANRDQLILAGLDEQNIHTCGLCTADNLGLFPSYRVEREKAGRIGAAIRAL